MNSARREQGPDPKVLSSSDGLSLGSLPTEAFRRGCLPGRPTRAASGVSSSRTPRRFPEAQGRASAGVKGALAGALIRVKTAVAPPPRRVGAFPARRGRVCRSQAGENGAAGGPASLNPRGLRVESPGPCADLRGGSGCARPSQGSGRALKGGQAGARAPASLVGRRRGDGEGRDGAAFAPPRWVAAPGPRPVCTPFGQRRQGGPGAKGSRGRGQGRGGVPGLPAPSWTTLPSGPPPSRFR